MALDDWKKFSIEDYLGQKLVKDSGRNQNTTQNLISAIDQISIAGQQKKQERVTEYGRSLQTQNRFDSRLNLPILNSMSDSTIYDNKTLDEIESKLESIKNEDTKRFPDQSVDFMDIYDTKLNKLKEYRSLNNQYNYYSSKVPETEKFLLDITEELSGIDWDDLDAGKKLELKERLYKGTQEISEFKKFMKNNADYFSNNRDFSSDSDKVNINLIGGYNQLLKQINTFDPEGTIISEDEQRMMIQSIRDGNPDEIRGRNELISTAANSRQKGYQDQFTNAYNQHAKNTIIVNSPDFQREAAIMDRKAEEKYEEYKNGKITLKGYIDWVDDPLNWQFILPEDGTPINVSEIRKGQASFERMMDEADANFEKETGSKYSEWMGKRTPWRTTEEQKEAKEEQKAARERGLTLEEYRREVESLDKPSPRKLTAEEEAEKFEKFRSTLPPLGAGRTIIGEGAAAKPPPIDYSGQTVEDVETKEPQNRDIGIMQVNEITFGKYNPSQMSQDEMIEFSAKIVNNKLPDSTVGEWNNNDGWNNWTTYKNKTNDYKLALGKSDGWLLGKGLSQQQLDKIDAEFETKKDKRIARAVMWAESKGDHSAININKAKEPKVKGAKQLTEMRDGKTVINYDVANTSSFKGQQVNLKKIASSKFSSLSKGERKKYGNLRNFMKAKYKEWLNKTGKYGKGAWNSEGDFIYFFPTKVSPKGTVSNISGVNIYDLFDRRLNMHPAFKGVARGLTATTSPSYKNFAKDFDEFRKFLQES